MWLKYWWNDIKANIIYNYSHSGFISDGCHWYLEKILFVLKSVNVTLWKTSRANRGIIYTLRRFQCFKPFYWLKQLFSQWWYDMHHLIGRKKITIYTNYRIWIHDWMLKHLGLSGALSTPPESYRHLKDFLKKLQAWNRDYHSISLELHLIKLKQHF